MGNPIVIEAKPVEKIEVELVGKHYVVTPPKAMVAMKMALLAENAESDPTSLVEGLNSWIRMAFPKRQGEQVIKRLEDPDDPLDLVHVLSLAEAMVERQTGNPTS